MAKLLKHKGYYGSVDLDLDNRCLHGKLEFIDDLVTYEGATVEALQAAFREAVEDYLVTCRQIGKEPENPFKGSFNIRIGRELHRKTAIRAKEQGVAINEFVKRAIEANLG